MLKKLTNIFLLGLLSLFVFSCTDSDNSSSSSTGNFSLEGRSGGN